MAIVAVPALTNSIASNLGNLLVLPLMQEFDLPRSKILLYLNAETLFMGALGPVAGWLLVRFFPWKVVLTGAAILGVGVLSLAFTATFAQFALIYVLALGVGAALAGSIAGQTLAVRSFPDFLGRVVGAQMVTQAILGVGLPMLIGFLTPEFGWRVPTIVVGIALLVLQPAMVLLFLRRRSSSVDQAHQQAASGSGSATTSSFRESFVYLRYLPFWLLVVATIPHVALVWTLLGNLIPHLHDGGVDFKQASVVFSFMSASAVVGAIVLGYVADRFSPAIVLVVVGCTSIAGCTLLLTDAGFYLTSAAAMLVFFGLGGIQPSLSTSVKLLFGQVEYPRVVGLIAVFNILCTFAPAAAGWMRDVHGDYQIAFGALLVLVSLALLSALRLATMKMKSLGGSASHVSDLRRPIGIDTEATG